MVYNRTPNKADEVRIVDRETKEVIGKGIVTSKFHNMVGDEHYWYHIKLTETKYGYGIGHERSYNSELYAISLIDVSEKISNVARSAWDKRRQTQKFGWERRETLTEPSIKQKEIVEELKAIGAEDVKTDISNGKAFISAKNDEKPKTWYSTHHFGFMTIGRNGAFIKGKVYASYHKDGEGKKCNSYSTWLIYMGLHDAYNKYHGWN